MAIDLTKYVNKIIPPNIYTIHEPLKPLFKINKYDTKVFIASRSVGKSYTMGTIALTLCRIQPNLRIGYFLPTDQQLKLTVEETFNKIINNSPNLLKMYRNISQDKIRVYTKRFANNSIIYFRHQIVKTEDEMAIKIRGAHPDVIIFDECQDLQFDFVDKIRPSIIASKLGLEFYAGTFKTEFHLSYDVWNDGNKLEWMVKCPNCGSENFATRENVDYDNLEYGPFCINCKTQLTRETIKNNGKLVATGNGKYDSLRISALFAYWIPWKVIIKQKLSSYEAFINEVVGEPSQMQDKIITEADIKRHCMNYRMRDYAEAKGDSLIFAGIDWAGDTTYTVLTIIEYKEGKFYVIYVKKYLGMEAQKNKVHEFVERDLIRFHPIRIFGDWGMGVGRNSYLLAKGFPMFELELTGGDNNIRYSQQRERFLVSKFRLIENFVRDLKSGKIKFPIYSDIAPFIKEYTVYTRIELKSRKDSYLTYDKEYNEAPDDAFMSLLFAYAAAVSYIDHVYTSPRTTAIEDLTKIYNADNMIFNDWYL